MVNTNNSWYQYPNASDSTNLYQVFNYINNISDNYFFPTMLLVIWFISFVSVFSLGGRSNGSAARAWTFSSFIVSILAIMTTIMGFLSTKYMYLTFVMLGLGVLWLKLSSPTIE